LKLDIIIPCYNEEQNLLSLLPYLNRTPSLGHIQIFVIDASQSDDNTQSICEQNGVSYLRSDQSQRSIQMNYGAQQSSSEVLLFLHADVTPPKDYYELIKEAIEDNNSCGCFAYKFDSNKILLKLNSYFTKYKGFFTGGGDQGLFITRDAFNALEGFCAKHVIMEDFDLYKRVKTKGFRFKIIKSKAIVSARKYVKNSWLRVNLINLIAVLRYKINPDPQSIKIFYHKWLNN